MICVYQPIPANFSLFLPISGYSSIFHPIPTISSLLQPVCIICINCIISLLPKERWDKLSIFKGQSNIGTVPKVATDNHTNIDPLQIFQSMAFILLNLEFGLNMLGVCCFIFSYSGVYLCIFVKL